MKLARFQVGQGRSSLGVVVDDGVVSLDACGLGDDMCRLIEHWDALLPDVVELSRSGPVVPFDRLRLLAPVARPSKILAIGLNYADHIQESGIAEPTQQLWFAKMPSAINGPFDPVQRPRVSVQLDHEVELVAVIGRGGRHIHRDDAHSRIFGYCVGNDFSIRDWQLRTSQWVLGKSFDTHAVLGPWIVTSDELPDPHRLGIRCTVDGVVRQRSNTGHLLFDVWAQVEHLSAVMTLRPGDVLYTGTPGGVGAAGVPPRWLQPGQRVRCSIDGIGDIENEVVDEPASGH